MKISFRDIIITVVCLAILVAGSLFYADTLSLPADSIGFTGIDPNAKWQTLLHFSLNAFYSWRFDSLLVALLNYFSDLVPFSYSTILWLHIIILGTGGFTLCLTLNPKARKFSAFWQALVSIIIVTILFGSDSTVICSISWLPWVALATFLSIRSENNRLPAAVLLVFVSFRLSASANQLALPLATVAIFSISSFLNISTCQPQQDRSKLLWIPIVFILLYLPTVLVLIEAPIPVWPDYPHLAHVVADDGLPGIIRPLIGADSPIPFINRHALHALYALPAVCLLFVTALVYLTRQNKEKNSLILTSFILSALVVLDTVMPEAFAQIAPIATLTRMLPGLYIIPLTPIFYAAAIILLVYSSHTYGNDLGSLLMLSLAILFPIENTTNNSLLFQPAKLQSYSARITIGKLEQEPKLLDNLPEDKIFSPSWNVIKDYGWSVFNIPQIQSRTTIRSIRAFSPKISASENNKRRRLLRLFDRKAKSRWSPVKGHQGGTEWLLVSLDKPTTLYGLQLDIRKYYYADFPRGIRILAAHSCPNFPSEQADFREVVNYNSWQGPIEFTEQGYPYFGGQSDVTIYFPKAITASCLKIEQIGTEPNFDWSVSELNVIVPNSE